MTNTQHTSPPASGRARLGWVLGLTSAAYFMVVLDSSVVLTALPQMQRDLRASLPSLQWTVNAYGISFAAGIITAAALGDRFGRRRIFNLGLIAVALASRLLPETHGAPARLDLPGVTLVTAGVIAIVWALVRASDTGWSSPQVVAALLAGAVLLAAFVARESRAAEPLVPLRLFRNRTFAVGNATMFFMSGAIFSAAFLILQEFQFARGYSPVAAGARLLPFFATPMLVSPLAGAVSDRIGRRPVMVTGLTLQALGFTWVAARGSLSTSWIELMLALLVAGIGISMALPTVPTAVLSAVALPEMGKASGINQMAQRLGTVFAIAISSAVFSAHGHLGSPAAVTAGFRPALWSCVVFAALAAVTAADITARLRCGQRDQASRRSPHRRLIHRTERNDQCPTSRATRSAPPTATTPTSPSTPRSIPSSPPCPPLPG
jgi:MFS family permease